MAKLTDNAVDIVPEISSSVDNPNNIFQIPSPSLTNTLIPKLSGMMNTQAQLEEQGYTYNQAGFTYNQLGVFYGGVYNNNEYLIPSPAYSASLVPSIYDSRDIYINVPIPHGTIKIGQPIATGFFMFITYPNQLTW